MACRTRDVWRGVLAAGSVGFPALAEPFVHIGQGFGSKWGDINQIGTGAVVTWGLVPDGTTIDPGFRIDPVGSPNDVGAVGGSDLTQLRTLIDTSHGAGAFDAAIRNAFDTWSAAADLTFIEVADPGTPIAQQGSTTPDIRIGAFAPLSDHFFEGTGAVGFGPPGFPDPQNDYPESGDILFNLSGNKFIGVQTPFHIAPGAEDVTPVDSFSFGDDIEGLFLHEVGHAIGLAHPPWNGDDPDRRVMYVGEFGNDDAPPCCTAINRQLHPDDIAGARFIYGPPTLTGDYNADGFVSQGDLDLVLLNWGDTALPPGFDQGALPGSGPFDELVSQNELDGVLLNWGNGTPPPASLAVPEPATAVLLALGGTVWTRRRPA